MTDLDAQPSAVQTAARATQRLGWQVLAAQARPNRVVSPSSLAMSLAVAAEGAEGASSTSIDGALGLSGDARATAFAALRDALAPYESLPGSVDVDDPPAEPVVHQASRVVAIEQHLGLPFLERVARFGAHPVAVERDEAQAALDAWVREHTAGLIERSGVQVTGQTRAVLQDAALFAAAWARPFPEERPMTFRAAAGDIEVDGVAGTVPALYAQGDGWTAIRLAYDEALAADVIVPTGSPERLPAEALDAAAEALAAAEAERVAVSMPRFDLAATLDLMAALPGVDLSDLGGIFPEAQVEQWTQQVRLSVSARGTVGAAVTEMALRAAGIPVPPRPFVVDRPYVFRVLDTRTGWPLFLAVVGDPSTD